MVLSLRGLKGSLLPKILVGILIIGIFFQISWTATSRTAAPVRTTPAADSPPTTIDDASQKNWFEDAKRPTQIGDDESSHALEHIAVDLSKIIIKYGASNCVPAFTPKMVAAALERNRTCAQHAPFPAQETRRVAFATITTGKPAEAYQRAIQSQMFASAVHGTSTHVLCEQLSDGTWNKIAYLLNLVMNEMLKPVDERLEWIMWIDRDAIVLDPCRPLSSFLPPNTTEFADVNLITNNDAGGLNNGVFIFKVSDWAIDLFNTILAFRYYRPDVPLPIFDQTAMEYIIKENKWKKHVAWVPWYWFNAYPDEDDSVNKFKDGKESEDLEWFRARWGDYVVHFAGDHGRSVRMLEWLDMLEKLGNVYEKEEQMRDVSREIERYWRSFKDGDLEIEQMSGEKWKENWGGWGELT
jgi:mannan polymerase II complex MNN10 subunit